jgi:pimeloyl-ACP methyl ester carboxylesterase
MAMKNLRKYGAKPYQIAVVHGGPGAPGYMAAVAGELSKDVGVLEPLQTKNSLEGQIEELAEVLKKNANISVVLIGHSWGAWLAFIVAAIYPSLVKKLILVASGPFEAKYAAGIEAERLNRLHEAERIEFLNLADIVINPGSMDKDESLAKLGALAAKADSYDALPLPRYEPPEGPGASEEINRKVWAEAAEMRISGELLKMGKKIKCPVTAIHGDYDPHPAEGVKAPLSRVLKDFRFILLEKCGHYPWLEKYAKDRFYEILKNELK